MAIFTDEFLTDNPVEGNPNIEEALGSPLSGPEPGPTYSGMGEGASMSREGLSGEQLSKIATLPGQGGGVNLIPLSEVAANKRYNTYVRGMDLENIYGMQQSALSQLGNSVVKMAGLAAGTFVQGFATIPNTISAIKNGKMADLSGGPDSYESAIDDWTKNIEDYFPNYYTRKEKESPYLAMIPFMPGSANFWGDKIIKNIGFTAGAIGSAIVQDAIIGTLTDGIGAAPLIASQLGKASLFINKLYAGATKVDKVLDLAKTVGKTGEQILNIKRLGEIAAGTKVANGFRYSMGIYGSSRTEAAIEARDGYRQVRDELLREYKIENAGREPSPSDLAQIESYATDAMNTRFGINMALLTASNTIQFGNLFKSFTSAGKGLSGQLTRDLEDIGKIGLKQGSLDVFEKKTAETIGGRVWDSVRPKFANILAEGVYEEGGQYAAEKGTYDYFTRKYKNLSNPLYKDNWNTTVEAVDSTVKGLKDQFGTSEGLENMIVGAISAMLTGGIMGRIDNAKGGGSDARLTSTINILNQYGLTGILSNQFDSTLTSAGIAAEMNEAVKNKDIFKYKNLKDDMFFDYASSRLPSGMHDVTIEQLKMLKDLSKEEFEKTFGMDFSSSNKSTVGEYVDALIDQANDIKDTHDSIDATFNNPFKPSINPKTPEEISENLNHTVFNKWKEELAYNASKIPSINSRLDSIQQSVFEINPQLTNSMLAQLTNKESLKDLSKNYEEAASQLNKTITEFTTPADSKKIKDQVKALRTASEKINLGLSTNVDTKLFEYLLNFEVNNQTPTNTKIVGPEWITDLFNYGHDINRHNELKVKVSKIFDNLSSEKGFNKYFDQAKEMQAEVITTTSPTIEQVTLTENVAPAFKNKSGQQEPIELNREYQIPASKKARVDKIADDRFQVTEPNGNITFYPSKEKADAAVAEMNEQFGNLQKVKIVAINADGTVKVEDINGDIYDISLSTLEGYEKIKSSQEKLLKDKNDIDAQQADIESKSGDTSTGVPEEDEKKIVYEDGFRKILSRMFTSTTAQSEADPTKLIPSSKRANIFRNNLKNFNNRSRIRLILVTQKQEAALGLDGLANLSMGSVGTHANVDNGFVAAVYVEQDGDNVYFVNEKGERTGKVGEKIALDKMIFDTMPSTSLSTPTGLRFDNKTTKEEDVQELANQWRAKREQLLNLTGSPEMYKFDLSRGIPKIGNKDARNAVGKTLVSEDLISTQQGLIVIPTTKTITHQGETINFPNGRPVLQYEDTLQPLNNKKFNKKEADAIFLVMQYLCDSIKEQSEKGQKVKIDRNFATFLQSVLYYRKSAETAKNQFYIDTATMEFFFSGKRYDITKIAESKDAITTQLLDVYNNVNNHTLTKEFDANFKEYYINDKGQLTTNTWENYQTYLMSSTYPNGTARPEQEIPLTTNVDKITDLAPTNYKAKYSILQGLELPQVVIAPVAPVAPAPVIITPAPIVTPVVEPVVEKVLSDDEKVLTFITAKISGSLPGSYNLDGDDFKFTAGNIRFTAKLNDKGKYDVVVNADDADNRETIDKIKATPASMVAINNFIEAGKPKAPEAPVVETKTETPASTDAKTDRIIEAKFAQQETQFYIEVKGEKKDFLLTWSRNSNRPTLWGEKQPDGIYKSTLEYPSEKDVQALVDKYVPKSLLNLINKWTEASKLPAGEVLDAQYKIAREIESELAALEGTKSDIDNDIQNVSNAKDKEELIKAAEKLIGINPYDSGAVSMGTRAALMTPGSFDRGKALFLEEVKSIINQRRKSEGVKPIPPKGKKKLGKKPPASGKFRKVGRNEENVEKMSDLDLQLFKEWHAKNAPTIPYEVLDGVIRINDTEKAWGAFEAGVAKFYKGAIRGTEYHEIFEGIWKAFLTSEQRQNILDEFKSQKGTFLDRESGKRISYDEATDLQAKERIADDFSEFRLGKLPGRTLKEKILKFFRDIINFFKSFVQKPSLKEDLFKSINKGKFKKSVISESVKNEPIEYSKIGNLTETQSYNFVQDITARVFQIIFSTNKSLYNLENINSSEIFNQIKNTYLEYGVIDDLDPDQLTSSEFDELVGRTKEFLRVFKIDFDYDGDASFNDDSRDKNEYASSPFVTDWKKLSPFAIKIVLASLTETVSTNQENNLLNLPDLKTDDETGTFKLLNFSRAFATCLNQFANTTDVNELVNKLGELAKDDSNYVRLYKRLGGVTDTEKAHINFKDFKMDDWRLFINFYQTFSKQKPDALVQYINGGDVYTATANLFEAKKEIKSNWIENLKGMISKPDSLISRNYSTNAYEIKTRKKDKNDKDEPNGVLDFPIRSTEDKIAFLAKLGIEFPIEAYRKLKTKGKTNQVDEFGKAVSAIREYFGSNQDILSFTGKTLGVNAQYDKLAELLIKVTNPNQELSFFGIDQKKIQAYAENNAISVLENDFNSVSTLDELLTLRPELTDLFSKNSVVLKKGGLFFNSAGKRIREFKVGYIQGTSNADLEKDVVTASLTFGNRYVQQLNQNLTGNYYVLVPADSSTEWMMNLGNIVKFADVESQKGKPAREQVHDIFMGYLKDDIALALADRKELINVAPRAKELRFFNDILSKELLKEVNQLIADDANTDQVAEFLNNNTDKINTSIDDYIKVYNDATIQTLKDAKRVVINSKNDYKFIDLDKDFALSAKLDKQSLSEKELNDIVMFANVNYIINNIEFHKLLFGDPYQFAIKDGQLDETKRVKAFLSGRRKMFNTPEFNTFLNQAMNQAGTIEEIENNEGIKLNGPDANNPDDFGDPGYHLNKDYANTVTFDDVKIIGSVATLNNIPPEIQKAYAKEAKETDGISFLMDGAYKEIKLKNGQWPREAEEWHQWQMAYTRQNFPGYIYKDNALEAHDKALVSKSEPKFMIDVLKPIVSGNRHNSNKIEIVLDKFSQMPIYFSMVKGTNLEKMYINMFKQQVDYAVVLSGRKVGAGASHSIYNRDGSFNETKYNNNVKVSWASYGIQVENAYQEGKQQTRGSQITKLVSIDIFDNGVATSERAQEEYTRNKKLLGLLHKNGYESFLKKLGIIDLGDGFKLINNTAVSETLIHEMLRRALSTNAKSTVKLNEENQFPMPFEASTSYLQIREILFSMVDKAILSPKVNGSPHVQVPVTGWENMGDRELLQKKDGKWKKISKEKYLKLSDEEKRKVAITDTTLKFYTREQPYCEILLPHWFKEKLGKNSKFKDEKVLLAYLNNTNEGRKILSGIGFRIPTQSLSSMEVFRVKGFLPQSMGSTVVVPSEIVTKAGSDFDIDKLNMYLKSIYIDVNGNIKLVEYKGSEEATREFYSNLFDEKLSKKIVTKEDLREAARILTYEEEDTEKLLEKYGSLLYIILDDYQSSDDYIDAMNAQLDELGDTNLQEQLKEKFVDDMYKRSLENEYFDSLEKLITLPENFDRLLSPVDDAGLEDVSKELDDLSGIDETNIHNRLLNRNYMTSLRHAFVIAKRWVGIAAVNITGQSLAQKSQVYIDPRRFEGLSKSDKKMLGNGEIALPHNTTKVDGVDRVSISGVKTADGKHFISSRLSGYITSFVDVAKNPYILKIIKSNLIVSTFMFLERIGVGENAAFFLNQPIISDYLKYLDSIDSKTLFNYNNIKFIKASYGGDSSGEFDISLLKENITNGASANKTQQVAIFDEFLKYAKMAEFSFKLTQASNYDTSKIRSSGALLKKRILTDKARKSNIFSSVDNILNNSFIAEQSSFASKSFEALGEVLKFDQPKFRNIINKVLTPFASREFMSDDDYARIENKIVTSFVDYVIQIKSSIGSEIKELLISPDTSVAAQLVKAKQDYPDMKIINDLQVASSQRLQNGAKSIKLGVNIKEAYDEDIYIGMMRELRDTEDLNNLYRNILKVAILQGTYQSAISIKNIIPIEDYSAEVAPIINKLTDDLDVQAFAKGWFQRNNFKGDDVFKTASPKFFHTSSSYETGPVPIFVDNFGNETYLYYSYAFPVVDSLGIGGLDRKILVLNETFNYLDVQNDYVKIPRVVTDGKTGEKIDMQTGETVTPSMYSEAKKKGDLSLKNIYGYEKVKHDDGTPLTFITDYKGEEMVNHVYKLINLCGENPYVTEHYSTFKPSEIDNGTIKIANEIPNNDIIDHFVKIYPEEALESILAEEVPEAVSGENFESTVPDANMAITNFYESLTPEQKTTLGPIEDVIADYESVPFDYSYEDYIESLNCKL